MSLKQQIETQLKTATVDQVAKDTGLSHEEVERIHKAMIRRERERSPAFRGSEHLTKVMAQKGCAELLSRTADLIGKVAKRDDISVEMAAFKLNYKPNVVATALSLGLAPPKLGMDFFGFGQKVDAVGAEEPSMA